VPHAGGHGPVPKDGAEQGGEMPAIDDEPLPDIALDVPAERARLLDPL